MTNEGTIHIDFSSTTTDTLLPEGDHVVAITGVNQAIGKSSGEPYLNWEFTVQDGEHAGRKCWTITSLQAHALFALKRLLKAVGVDSEGTVDFDPASVIGEQLRVTIAHEEYDGEDRVRVTRTNSLSTEQAAASSF